MRVAKAWICEKLRDGWGRISITIQHKNLTLGPSTRPIKRFILQGRPIQIGASRGIPTRLFESPRFGGGTVLQSHGQRNDGQGNGRHDFGFIPLPNIPLPLFSLVSRPSQILHFVPGRVKLAASTPIHS
jgi:hypothetical protein